MTTRPFVSRWRTSTGTSSAFPVGFKVDASCAVCVLKADGKGAVYDYMVVVNAGGPCTAATLLVRNPDAFFDQRNSELVHFLKHVSEARSDEILYSEDPPEGDGPHGSRSSRQVLQVALHESSHVCTARRYKPCWSFIYEHFHLHS